MPARRGFAGDFKKAVSLALLPPNARQAWFYGEILAPVRC
jgi:hypothetical protein